MSGTRILPPSWMPNSQVEAVVLHWTGGTNSVSNLDLKHYHFIIPGSCQVQRGYHSIPDNQNLTDGKYAAHVKGFNAYMGKAVIGVSLCGMFGAKESPFNPGNYPITEDQWKCAALVVADLCERYGIAVDDRHVLQHGEVQEKRNRPQNGKWDCNKVPWSPQLTKPAVCNGFRGLVQAALNDSQPQVPTFPTLTVKVDSVTLETPGLWLPGRALAPLRALEKHFGWKILSLATQTARVRLADGSIQTFAFENIGGTGYVPVASVALALDWQKPDFDAVNRTVTLVTS
jgi:hypothetical protein